MSARTPSCPIASRASSDFSSSNELLHGGALHDQAHPARVGRVDEGAHGEAAGAHEFLPFRRCQPAVEVVDVVDDEQCGHGVLLESSVGFVVPGAGLGVRDDSVGSRRRSASLRNPGAGSLVRPRAGHKVTATVSVCRGSAAPAIRRPGPPAPVLRGAERDDEQHDTRACQAGGAQERRRDAGGPGDEAQDDGAATESESMNRLAVPAALPRSDGGTRLKTAANTAGVRKAVPTPSMAAPAKRLHTAGTAATRSSPAPEAPSAAAARRNGGTRSGNVAKRRGRPPRRARTGRAPGSAGPGRDGRHAVTRTPGSRRPQPPR